MSDLVTITIEGGVADVRLDRPDKMNALSPAMFRAIVAAGDRLRTEHGLRAVVLSGNGRAFCAGLDLMAMQGGGDGASLAKDLTEFVATAEQPDNPLQRIAIQWQRIPVPVIAAIHGVAFGAGCQMALGADLRVARPDARLSIMEIKWGLVPDVGISQTLRDLVPLDVAKDLVWTGRIVDGEEARRLGLVTALADDPLAAALEKAREIAGKSPHAIRAGKRLLDETRHADALTGLVLEAGLQRALLGSRNQMEAVAANFEKRPPRFDDPE